jgi:lipopolysaccharide transport system ATP-binding protein
VSTSVTTVIDIDRLSKRYVLGGQDLRYATFRENLRGLVRAPFKAFSRSGGGPEYLWALRDITFSVSAGEIVGLIGPNGSGKSTLLKILSRITRPTAGRATLRGRVGSLLEVGTGFHPELTGRDNIFLSGAVLGMQRQEVTRRFDEIAEFSGIERFLDTPVKHYSSGMYVRLGFAVAAHLEPEILLVDEVLAVGDMAFQKKCLEKMATVARGGRTVIFVSHNLAAVRRICERAVFLRAGEIASDGPVKDVVEMYLHTIYDTEQSPTRSKIVYPAETAPGDRSVRLASVELMSESGAATSVFRIDEGFRLSCEYDILEKISNFHLYLRVYLEDGTLAFCTADWDGGEVAAKDLLPGRHTASVSFPPHLLNAGSYQMDVLGIIPSIRTVFHVSPAIHWTVTAQGGAGGVESVARPGIVRPMLRWCFGAGQTDPGPE